MLVIHENRGLTDHIRSVAGRLAASGYSALAIDLLSEEGGTGVVRGRGRRSPRALTACRRSGSWPTCGPASTSSRQRTPGAEARRDRASASAVAWCGRLLAAGEPRLAAAAPFYGPLPDGADFGGSRNAAVLGVYAEQDARVNASRDAAEAR